MTKAVIFTHLGRLTFGRVPEPPRLFEYAQAEAEFNDMSDKLFASYREMCERYLAYNASSTSTISLVYGYVDWALKVALPDYDGKEGRFQLDAGVLRAESRLKGLLAKAEQEARRSLRLSPGAPPSFEFVRAPTAREWSFATRLAALCGWRSSRTCTSVPSRP